jgi:hypothetical protein
VGLQQVDQVALHDDAGAARLHRIGDALVNPHVEARALAIGFPIPDSQFALMWREGSVHDRAMKSTKVKQA